MIPMCLLRFPLIRRSINLAGPERTVLMLLLILDTIVTLIVPERSSPASLGSLDGLSTLAGTLTRNPGSSS